MYYVDDHWPSMLWCHCDNVAAKIKSSVKSLRCHSSSGSQSAESDRLEGSRHTPTSMLPIQLRLALHRLRPYTISTVSPLVQTKRPMSRTAPSPQALTAVNITFLGTASAQPSSTRNHSSLALRLDRDVWIFDCGEATQHQIQRSAVKMGKINKVFVTHTHGAYILTRHS